MAGNSHQKQKILMLVDIFERYTDEENSLTAAMICKKLESEGVSAERKAIYDDIASLIDFGYDIVKLPAPKGGYFLASRKFESPEVRLLLDVVQSAPFITPKKTRELAKKLATLTSENYANQISGQVYIDSRVKCENEEIYYSIDMINKAIVENRKIKFKYAHKKISSKGQAKEMVVSPYAMLWSNDHYYFVGNYSKYDNISHYRIDRMRGVTLIDEKSRPFQKVSEYRNFFDIADYSRRTLNMFSGKSDTVEMKFAPELEEVMLDKFGMNVSMRKVDERWFILRISANISEGLVNWIMQFGHQIEVIRPAELREMICARVKEMYTLYQMGSDGERESDPKAE